MTNEFSRKFGLARSLVITLGVLIGLSGRSATAGPLEEAADAYRRGDYVSELRLLRLAADKGDAPAAFMLGQQYELGQGVQRDSAEADRWYQKAAEAGYAPAQYTLGTAFETGHGVARDYVSAVAWYRRAADQGWSAAQYNLGVAYENGNGVPQDFAAAVDWYRKAANETAGHAQGNLAFKYPSQGVLSSLVRANAESNLGVAYDKGRGVAQDYATAASFFSKAAAEGNVAAQYSLAGHFELGLGVPKDPVRAYTWFSLAAMHLPISDMALRPKAIAGRDRVAATMSREQITEAEKRAKDWKP